MNSDCVDLHFENAYDGDASSIEQKVLNKNDWQCKNCHLINKYEEILHIVIDKNKCYSCKFRKPNHFNCKNYTHCADELVFGYCREIRDAKDFRFINVPAYLINVIKAFYIIKLQETIRTTEHGIYIWNFSIIPSKTYCKRKLKPKDFDIKEQYVFGVSCPYASPSNWLSDDRRERKKYCPQLKVGDIITMQADFTDCSLSFGINNDWYGQFEDINGNFDYEARFYMEYTAHAEIKLNRLTIIPIKRISAKIHIP